MQTKQFIEEFNHSIATKLINGLRSLFGGLKTENDTLAANCAADISRVKGLAEWIDSIASLTHSERAPMLHRAAGAFIGEFSANDLANTLSCMASDAGLFLAIHDALRKSNRQVIQFALAA